MASYRGFYYWKGWSKSNLAVLSLIKSQTCTQRVALQNIVTVITSATAYHQPAAEAFIVEKINTLITV